MKKLVVSAFAVALCATANAAMCQWSIYDDALVDATRIYSFADGSIAATFANYLISGNYTSAADFESAIAGYTADGVNEDGYVEGKADAGDGVSMTTMSALFIDATTEGSGVYVLSDVDVTGWTFERGQQGPGMYDLTGSSLAAGTVTFKDDPGPTPVPEPTTGLLVLLGMAGLALKRKIA